MSNEETLGKSKTQREEEESEEEGVNVCKIKGCSHKAVEDGLCLEHKGIEELKKECEIRGCDNVFDVTDRSQKYCKEHRAGGEKYHETVRVTQYGWEAKQRVCKLPECGNIIPKNRSKFCSDECYNKGKRREYMLKRMERLSEEYGLKWEEAIEFNKISIDLSIFKSKHGFEKFYEIIDEMLEEEGKEFVQKCLFRVNLTHEERIKLPVEPPDL